MGRDELVALGRDLFGFELRAEQVDAALAAVRGSDVLAVLPTGSGKSAIYQVAGAAIDGVTLVVSPLIALQHDQVAHIGDDLGAAAQVNSTIGDRQRREVFERARHGELEFIFAAPEQLANDETRAALAELRPSLLVVDEAHCISTLGHDFRPEYRRLRELRRALGDPRVIALTATAAPPVRADIVAELGMDDPEVVVAGFERPNLHVAVRLVEDARDPDLVAEVVGGLEGSGIVYVPTRAEAEELADRLGEDGRPSLAYHAGLDARTRADVLARFGQPDPCVVVGTTAFGMGIDVPHVRFVVHVDAPESIDAYAQEIGRAGRDGDPARAVLLHTTGTSGGRRFFAGVSEVGQDQIRAVAGCVAPVDEIAVVALRELTELPDTRLGLVLGLLERTGAVAVEDEVVRWTYEAPEDGAVGEAYELREAERAVERSRQDMVERYLVSDGCRWQALRSYFGDPTDERCGHCDRCDQAPPDDAVPSDDAADGPFRLGQPVEHERFGAGQVIEVDADKVTVLFDEVGYRTLALEVVVERGLLAPLG